MEAFSINHSLVIWANQLVSAHWWLAELTVFTAVYLGWLLVVFLLAYSFRRPISRHNLRLVVASFLAGLIALVTASLVKYLWPTSRPMAELSGITPLFVSSGLAAFPSMHTAFFGALALFMWHYHRVIGCWLVIMALSIGLARVAAGVHYPLDILGGWLIAAVSVWLVNLVFVKVFGRVKALP